MTHHFSCPGREKSKKIFLGPFDQIGPQIRAKNGHFGSKFSKKMKNFQKYFFFDLNNSESKKGQKKFFSLLNWSDTYHFWPKK